MFKLGFIGMGNMAGAIACGIAQSGFLKGEEMIAYDIVSSQLDKLDPYHFQRALSEKEVVEKSDIVFIGVKPQVVEGVIAPLKDALKNKAVISIVLGYDFKKYESILDTSTRHIFVMPNTPALVLKGMSLIEAKHSLTEEEFVFTQDLFRSIGSVEIVPSHLMNAAGTLSGCGPAFIYMVIEALADGAVKE
ncbi:MAG: NAD(P)-binding domain-containing protein, partial [Erysipelotrichaceae bacterium]|nr:NAD(P)-binding domain-containing protein [Erysipelotrichaceae bacterium]